MINSASLISRGFIPKWSVLHLLIPEGLVKEDSTTGGIVHLFRMTEKTEEVCEQVSKKYY